MSARVGLYVHFPFCLSKCNYCDFSSQVAPRTLREEYMAALIEQVGRRLRVSDVSIATVFFGGGTPTLYSPAQLGAVLDQVTSSGKLMPSAEVTTEANPETVDADYLQALRDAGFNRISFGVQSFHDDELRALGRCHTAAKAREAIVAARAIFDNLSFDLIYGIPGQTAESWNATLREAISLGTDHISAYGLMIEEDTPLIGMVERGEVTPLPDDTYADFYAHAQVVLAAAGFEHYEISNWARPGFRCRHNLIYWHNREYLGLGAAAAGFMDGVRYVNIADPAEFCRRIVACEDVVESSETLDVAHRVGETIMLALRTADGIDLRELSHSAGIDLEAAHDALIAALVGEKIARYADGVLRLTPEKGFLLHSEVARRFFP